MFWRSLMFWMGLGIGGILGAVLALVIGNLMARARIGRMFGW